MFRIEYGKILIISGHLLAVKGVQLRYRTYCLIMLVSWIVHKIFTMNLQNFFKKSYINSTIWDPLCTYVNGDNACSYYLHFEEFSEDEVFEELHSKKPLTQTVFQPIL